MTQTPKKPGIVTLSFLFISIQSALLLIR